MISWRVWISYGALIALAVLVAVLAGRPQPRSALPVIENSDPPGLRALALYLQETGVPVSVTTESLAHFAKPGTLVIAGPTQRELTHDEREGVEQFVKSGGRLVYFAPRELDRQPELKDWLELERGPSLDPVSTFNPDALVDVVSPVGAAAGLHTLSIAAVRALSGPALAVPIAAQHGRNAVMLERFGKGEVWIASGTELADNVHIDKADNLGLVAQLVGHGPVTFDEGHFVLPPSQPMSRALWVFFLQLLVLGLAFLWMAGARLGPPRTAPLVRHRASREYLDAFAWLTRRARVEPELASALYDSLRRRAHERLGIALEVSDDEAARRIASNSGADHEPVLALMAKLRAAAAETTLRPRRYAELAVETAKVEAAI